MKTIYIGNKELGLRATPLALLFYNQEFNKDLLADLTSMQNLQKIDEGDFSGLNTVKILQMVYAMNKADNLGKQFPGFEKWLADFESIDFGDETWLMAVVEEAEAGFFRSAGGTAE